MHVAMLLYSPQTLEVAASPVRQPSTVNTVYYVVQIWPRLIGPNLYRA